MPHWALRAFPPFPSPAPRNLITSNLKNEKQNDTDVSWPLSRYDFTQQDSEKGFVTLPNTDADPQPLQAWFCICDLQLDEFCPYCECDRSSQFTAAVVDTTSYSPLTDLSSALSTAESSIPRSPHKLRKTRTNYQQLHYEALNTADVVAAKPDSIISADSRTPLLNIHADAKAYYAPVPARRPPNKLGKKGRNARTLSLSGSSSLSLSSAPAKCSRRETIASRMFLRNNQREETGPRPKPLASSIETDALVTLAWTGQTASSIQSPERSLSHSTPLSDHESQKNLITGEEKLLSSRRRSLLQKKKNRCPVQEWTLAMAIIDDAITDENFVNELELMRIKEVQAEPFDLGLELHPYYRSQLFDSHAEYPLQVGETQEEIFPTDSSWTAARQVLLLCRELVCTERRYLASLKCLITSGTSTPPPSSMLPYLPDLIIASESLLKHMEVNPNVQGISEAFLACEEDMEEAFVAWCSVVGHFFDSEEKPTLRKAEGNLTSAPSASTEHPMNHASQPLIRRIDSSLSIVTPEPNKIRKNVKLRPTVRDLAILPTQRVVRYVLLFKELYSITPTTVSSFLIVQKALHSAERIASLANNAQGHSAFEP